jgi:hypothetical protein
VFFNTGMPGSKEPDYILQNNFQKMIIAEAIVLVCRPVYRFKLIENYLEFSKGRLNLIIRDQLTVIWSSK